MVHEGFEVGEVALPAVVGRPVAVAVAGLADEEYDAQWKACREASAAVQAAITAHATESGASRYDVEQAVKRAARRIEQDPTE
ncbi:hypothetical protein [Streptomyces sp. NPDC005141]